MYVSINKISVNNTLNHTIMQVYNINSITFKYCKKFHCKQHFDFAIFPYLSRIRIFNPSFVVTLNIATYNCSRVKKRGRFLFYFYQQRMKLN